MKLTITQADLDAGHALTPLFNPLTWAIHRQTGWSYAYLEGRLWPVAGPPVQVPGPVRNWISGLLRGKPATLRTFVIDLPAPAGTGRCRKEVLEEIP